MRKATAFDVLPAVPFSLCNARAEWVAGWVLLEGTCRGQWERHDVFPGVASCLRPRFPATANTLHTEPSRTLNPRPSTLALEPSLDPMQTLSCLRPHRMCTCALCQTLFHRLVTGILLAWLNSVSS